MTVRTRKTIFRVLVALFFLIGALVVLYAEGWRLNFSTFHAEKVGGIYVRAYPENAAIALNGKPVPNQANFLSHGTLLSDLFPKNYTLSLSLPGYDAWSENAAVSPSYVIEMKYAVLVPQTGTAIATTSDATDFFTIGGDVVEQRASGTITWADGVVGNGAIISHSADLKNLIYEDAAGDYELYDFTTNETLNLTAILAKDRVTAASIESIAIDPYNDTAALVAAKNRILTINFSAQAATAIATSSPGDEFEPALASSQTLLAWSEFNPTADTSTVVVYDKFSGAVTDRSLTLPGATQSLAWINGDTIGALQSDGSLSLHTVSTGTTRPLASDVKAFYPTADGALLATLETNSVEIFDFADNNYYRFNIPDIGAVQGLAWYKDETHLFVTYPDHVSFFDLADTNLINVTTVSAGTMPMYDPDANALYLIKGGDILRFDFPN